MPRKPGPKEDPNNIRIDGLKAIQILAMSAVTASDRDEDDPDYLYRHISRWYSREFHTPLSEVDEVPIDEVLTAYFECRYEAMDEDDREETMRRLVETRAEEEARKGQEDADSKADDEFVKLAKEKAAKKEGPPVGLRGIGGLPMVDKPVAPIEEGITMRFVSDKEFEELTSFDVMGPPQKGTLGEK